MNSVQLHEQENEHMTELESMREIIVRMKEVQKSRGLKHGDIKRMLDSAGVNLAKSTISNLFSEGSEDRSFSYEYTVRPVARVLLGIETIEETDDEDVKAMKAILKYKIERIEELEAELNSVKVKYHEKLDRERERHQKSVDFLTHQIELKDKRMDQLLEAVFAKDKQQTELLDKILNCPCRKDW